MCRHIIYKKCLSNVVFNIWKLFNRFYSKKWPSKKSNYAKKNRLKILYRMPYSKNRDLFSRTNFDHFRFSSKILKTKICGGWINLFNPQKSTQPSLSKGLVHSLYTLNKILTNIIRDQNQEICGKIRNGGPRVWHFLHNMNKYSKLVIS